MYAMCLKSLIDSQFWGQQPQNLSDFDDFPLKVAWWYLYSAISNVILLTIGSSYKPIDLC